jgi:Ca2+-binding RTX toxin-like protein
VDRDVLDSIENVLGSAYADEIVGDAGDNVVEGGRGVDTLRGGAGSDTFVLRQGDGADALELSDLIGDYQDGTDSIGLAGGLNYSGLLIEQGSGSHANDTVIKTVSGQYLAILQNVNSSILDVLDFKSIAG